MSRTGEEAEGAGEKVVRHRLGIDGPVLSQTQRQRLNDDSQFRTRQWQRLPTSGGQLVELDAGGFAIAAVNAGELLAGPTVAQGEMEDLQSQLPSSRWRRP